MAVTEPVAHCLRCHVEQRVVNVRRERLVNNRVVERGTCAACGTSTSRFVKDSK